MKIRCSLFLVLLAVALAGCVNVDPETGKTIPRGEQKNEYAYVKQRADQLREGMTKMEVTILLGSPAQTGGDGNVWDYVPERPAVLVPAQGLRLVFDGGLLKSHEFTTVAFGKPL
jgi:outer membrane protein assembly factor BamE (lipoprotein component of BamABCDE complex)